MMRSFLGMGLGAVFCAIPALADEPRSVPIHMSDSGHILADVLVGGEGPYTFIIDTAAGSTVVFEDFARRAGLAEVPGAPAVRVQGASGGIEARIVEMGEIQMGEWTFTLDQAVAFPAPPHIDEADGVLGANVLMAQPVGFALGEGVLQIYDEGVGLSAAEVAEGEWTAATIDQRFAGVPFYWTTVVVDGVAIEAVIDTGARRSAINPAGAMALGINPETAPLVEDEPIRGATADETPAFVLPVTTVQLGERVWGSRQLTLSDLPIFSAMGRAEVPTIVFGADFLTEQNFIIDPVDGRLWLRKRQSAALGYLTRPTTELSAAIH